MAEDQANDLFNGAESQPNLEEAGLETTTNGEPANNPLETLVGEGKKFKTVDDLAYGKLESDRFIAKLLKEQEEMRSELKERLTMEEAIRKMSEQNRPREEEPRVQSREDESEDRRVSLTDVEKLVQTKISEDRELSKLNANLASVKDELIRAYGPNYADKVRTKLRILGVGDDWGNNLAATQPRAFLNLVVDNQTRGSDDVSPPVSGLRTAPPRSGARNYGDYQKLRKENPGDYFSTKVQMQMHKDATEQGDDFYKA